MPNFIFSPTSLAAPRGPVSAHSAAPEHYRTILVIWLRRTGYYIIQAEIKEPERLWPRTAKEKGISYAGQIRGKDGRGRTSRAAR
jgi:hypothetical protein